MPRFCVVKTCKFRTDQESDITLHHFPQNPLLREKWERIIAKTRGMESYQAGRSSVVCSRHFLDTEMYFTEKGIRRLHKTAIPTLQVDADLEPKEKVNAQYSKKIRATYVKVCRVCLASDVRMYSLQHEKLKSVIESVSELRTRLKNNGLPLFVCYECGAQILKYYNFLEKILKAQTTLLDIYEQNGVITKDLVRERDRKDLTLQSSLTLTPKRILVSIVGQGADVASQMDSSYIDHGTFVKNEDNLSNIKIEVHENIMNNIKNSGDSINLGNTNEEMMNQFKSENCNKNETSDLEEFGSNFQNENSQNDVHFLTEFKLESADNSEKYDFNINTLIDNIDTLSHGDSNEFEASSVSCSNEESDNITKKRNTKRISKKPAKDSNKSNEAKIPRTRKKSQPVGPKKLTRDEAALEKLTGYDIVDVPLQEQLEEWKKEIEAPAWWTNGETFTCEVCFKKFNKEKACEKHSLLHKPYRGDIQCEVCKERFQNKKRLYAHSLRTHSKRYICKNCPKVFNNFSAARRHGSLHSGQTYRCARCSYSTLHRSVWWLHVRTQHGRQHCARCGRAFVSLKGLRTHRAKQHPGEDDEKEPQETFRCEQCDIVFHTEGARRVHILTSKQHKAERRASADPRLRTTCRKCAATFDCKRDLFEHKRTKHCEYLKTQGSDRLTPVLRYPRPCDHCGVELETRRKHWHHIQRAHPTLRHTYRPVVAAVCATCGKGFQSTKHLEIHEYSHGAPTFACSECPRKFHDPYALGRHRVTHSPHKPYPCRVCGRTFKIKTNLGRHMRTHTGATPYECNLCNKKFRYWDSLSQHLKHVHQKMPWPARDRRGARIKKTSEETPA